MLWACALFVASTLSAASAFQSATIRDVSLGQNVLILTRSYGPPDIVQTLDEGHEWRWFNAGGIDRDLLTDDDMQVRQIVVERPKATVAKSAPPLVQPQYLPLLDATASAARSLLQRLHAAPIGAPAETASLWRLGDYVVLYEIEDGRVKKVGSVDAAWAQRLGYLPASVPTATHQAPVLLHLNAVGYPHDAIETRAQGLVVLRVTVNVSGSVDRAEVLLSSGHPEIDQAEALTMRRSTFRPARCAAKPCNGVYLDLERYEIDPAR